VPRSIPIEGPDAIEVSFVVKVKLNQGLIQKSSFKPFYEFLESSIFNLDLNSRIKIWGFGVLGSNT